jgi:predicted amidophosphoribosyltransferase
VQGAFAGRAPERISGRVVLLVDDVVTTGATMEACAGALRSCGASRVYGLAFAIED